MSDHIRDAITSDIDAIVALSEQKRLQYQAYQPLFWRKAANSAEKQKPFLTNLISQEQILALVHEIEGKIDGYVIANIGSGEKCAIDDFAIADASQWNTVGYDLLMAVGQQAKDRGSVNYEVVCGHLDQPKRLMLKSVDLEVKQLWFTGPLASEIEYPSIQSEQIQLYFATHLDRKVIAEMLGRDDAQVQELDDERLKVLLCHVNGQPHGILIGLIVPTPPVYDPGGDTCLVTELLVTSSPQQTKVCHALLSKMGEFAQNEGAVQFVVPCDTTNEPKRSLLTTHGLTIASEWFYGKI